MLRAGPHIVAHFGYGLRALLRIEEFPQERLGALERPVLLVAQAHQRYLQERYPGEVLSVFSEQLWREWKFARRFGFLCLV